MTTEGPHEDARREERRFPIQGGPSIPWSLIEPHEAQAKRNHDQTLQRLAERGGLSPCEAVAVLEDRPWERMEAREALTRLKVLIQGAGCPLCSLDDGLVQEWVAKTRAVAKSKGYDIAAPKPQPAHEDAIRQLVKEWRRRANEVRGIKSFNADGVRSKFQRAAQIDDCADELERLLPPPPSEAPK